MKIEDIAKDPRQLGSNWGVIDVVFENPITCSSGFEKVFAERDMAVFADGELYAPGRFNFEQIKQSQIVYLVRIHYNGKKVD